MKKRLLSILLTACLLVGLLPTVALAADPVTGVPYLDETGTSQTCSIATEVSSSDTTWGANDTVEHWYVVTGNVTIGTEAAPQRVTVSGDVHLILADGCELTVNGGIQVEDPNALTIYAQSTDESTMGTLNTPNVGIFDAAIGGNNRGGYGEFTGGSGGTITINGGTVTATSTGYGAAIGGSRGVDYGGNGGIVTINGGIVTATSTYGAGIGGGYGAQGGNGGIITINGGTVIAESQSSAGIGRGGGPYRSEAGTFQTNADGNAVIFASSIADKSNQSTWSGIIVEGNTGAVYGTAVTPSQDFTIPTGKTLTIDSGKTLTIPEDVTMTNEGTVENSGSIYVDGTLSGTVGGTGGVYYPLTLKYCTATETSDPSTNSKTYGKAGSTITLTPDIPLTGLTFAKWNVSLSSVEVNENNSFKMPSAALTVTAQFTSVPGSFVEVSTEAQLRLALDSGATSIKLMADFQLANDAIKLNDKEITLDLNGHYIVSSDYSRYKDVIMLEDTSAGGNTSLTLIDSRPEASHWSDTLPNGGLIRGKITVTVKNNGTNCQLIANGGSVMGQVGLQSTYTSIRCTNDIPTAFYNDALSYGKIYGGIFYGNYTVIGIQGKTVTFNDTNGNLYAREVVESGKTAVAPIPPKATTADGYHINWYKENADVSYDFSTPVTGDITLFAKWENTYRITYDTGCDATISPIMQEVSTNVTLPAAPTRTGYTFTGWNDGTATYQAGTEYTMPAKDVTFTAQWAANRYTINYAGIEGVENAGTLPATHTYDTATKISDPIKTGYTFEGWLVNDGETLVKELTLGATDYTADITLTAVWDHYTVTLDTNGGTIREGNVTEYTYGVGAKLPVFVTKTGYHFAGWYDNKECMGRPVTEITTTDFGNKTFYAAWTPASLTYPITVETAENGAVTASRQTASKGATVTLTVEPDKGYTLETLTVTDKNGNEIELTNKGDGKYTFKMPGSKVTVKATFMEDNSMLNFFVDVFPGDYYYDAVLWAAENDITGGVDDTHFAPNAPCTRAQAVTFLWRAAGCPAPQSHAMPFTDVAEGSYYYDAVLWAVENGITKGTSDTTFDPDATCNRGQIVTFLWRSQNSPAVGSGNPFDDVKAEDYYADAVLWAVKEDVTNGTSDTTFSPADDCTRAQIVTFLYRT